MKKTITRIARFFTLAVLLFGAASWVHAQEAPATDLTVTAVDPQGGATKDDAPEISKDTKEFTFTFNKPVTLVNFLEFLGSDPTITDWPMELPEISKDTKKITLRFNLPVTVNEEKTEVVCTQWDPMTWMPLEGGVNVPAKLSVNPENNTEVIITLNGEFAVGNYWIEFDKDMIVAAYGQEYDGAGMLYFTTTDAAPAALTGESVAATVEPITKLNVTFTDAADNSTVDAVLDVTDDPTKLRLTVAGEFKEEHTYFFVFYGGYVTDADGTQMSENDTVYYKIRKEPLKVTAIDPQGGTTPEEALEITTEQTTFTVTFNKPLEEGTTKEVKFVDAADANSTVAATLTVNAENAAQGVVAVTGEFKEGQTYSLTLDAATGLKAADGSEMTEGAVYTYYYTIKVNEAGVDEVSAAKEVVATYIYSISGARMSALTPGVNIVKTVYSDGTTTVVKMQVK